ncbi:MAG: VOC family protein [Clostridia bacterium]|nr:VOC family protein [Clostridia bacterium]
MNIHHIGYLVKKIERAKQSFLKLGYALEQDVVYDDYRKVDICFLTKDGYRVELVSPKSEDSVVAHLIKQYRNAPYHLCYETEHFDEEKIELEANGFTCMGEPCPAPALGGRRVVFLMSPAIGIIELYEA